MLKAKDGLPSGINVKVRTGMWCKMVLPRDHAENVTA
jgi:hypothetical protein